MTTIDSGGGELVAYICSSQVLGLSSLLEYSHFLLFIIIILLHFSEKYCRLLQEQLFWQHKAQDAATVPLYHTCSDDTFTQG